MNNLKVNSSIGSSWGGCASPNSRSSRLEQHARRQQANGCPQPAVWEYVNSDTAPPTDLYDDVVEQVVVATAPQSWPTEDNVRISRVLTTTLGACAALACPPSVGPYRGGAHGCTKKPTGDGLDSHHIPADAATAMPKDMGPAIQMEPEDHRRTSFLRG